MPETTTFQYDPEIVARFPKTIGGIVLLPQVQNVATGPVLLDAYRQRQETVRRQIGETPLSQLPSLAAWRGVFRAFGVDPTAIRSAPEALLRRLTKQGDIPSINALVDIGNMVSITNAIPVAMMALHAASLPVTVRFATGVERYRPLGSDAIEHPEPGEVIFADTTGMVLARRWAWRQSAESATLLDTTALFVAVEAQHNDGRATVTKALEDLQSLLSAHLQLNGSQTVLDAAHLATPW